MQSTTAATVYLKDYTVPAFLIPEVELDISLFEDDTRVRAKLVVERNGAAADPRAPLAFDIDELTVESVALNGVALTPDRYKVDARHLTIPNLPDRFELTTVSRIVPKKNTKLMGIYTSHTGFFSLCEAEGFRRITPFLDRPDVMARYTVTLHADRERYPVLLANGNLIAQGEEADGRHWATWQDPFPKPSYLFAVVAARLDRSSDSFVTRSGRKVLLQFFVEPGKLDQGAFALEALKKAMKWDEDTYGLEVDLDQYNVVAVGDFNAGAMENKGLNVFNTKLVLARPLRLQFHRPDRRARVFPQLDRKPGHMPRLVSAVAQGRADRLSGRAVRRRHIFETGGAHSKGACAALLAVSGRRRPDGASGAAIVLRADQQLLHLNRLRQGRRGRAHDAHAGRR
jgi:aminopeptidase N